MATVPGIDVSYWNAGIDWPKVRAAGQRYAFCKGNVRGIVIRIRLSTTTGVARKRLDSCEEPITSSAANVDAKKQANKFIDYVNSMNDNGELPPVLDLETTDGQSREKVIARAKTWLDLVEAAFNRKPMIYSDNIFCRIISPKPAADLQPGPRIIRSGWRNIRTVYVEGSQPTLATRLVQVDILAVQ